MSNSDKDEVPEHLTDKKFFLLLELSGKYFDTEEEAKRSAIELLRKYREEGKGDKIAVAEIRAMWSVWPSFG